MAEYFEQYFFYKCVLEFSFRTQNPTKPFDFLKNRQNLCMLMYILYLTGIFLNEIAMNSRLIGRNEQLEARYEEFLYLCISFNISGEKG